MANTYTQIHIHLVFAVKNRRALISPLWEDELYKYITGIVKNNKHKLLAINGMPDHVHILIGLRPYQSISELIKKVKQCSSAWISTKGFLQDRFSWQAGYGAFSCSSSEIRKVINYIKNQKSHHKSKTFEQEYIIFLDKYDVEYNEKHVFGDFNPSSKPYN